MDQKSLVVDDFAKWLRPSLGDIAANTIEDVLHPTARPGIPGDLLIPRINLAEFEVGKPGQKFLPLAQRKRLHLLGDLLHAGRHSAIIARTALWRQSKASPRNCRGSANGRLQQIAANRLTIPQNVIAILLQGFVRCSVSDS